MSEGVVDVLESRLVIYSIAVLPYPAQSVESRSVQKSKNISPSLKATALSSLLIAWVVSGTTLKQDAAMTVGMLP